MTFQLHLLCFAGSLNLRAYLLNDESQCAAYLFPVVIIVGIWIHFNEAGWIILSFDSRESFQQLRPYLTVVAVTTLLWADMTTLLCSVVPGWFDPANSWFNVCVSMTIFFVLHLHWQYWWKNPVIKKMTGWSSLPDSHSCRDND